MNLKLKFVSLTLLISALVIATFVLFVYINLDAYNVSLERERVVRVAHITSNLESKIGFYSSELKFVAQAPVVQAIFRAYTSPDNFDVITELSTSALRDYLDELITPLGFSETKFDQILFIDSEGEALFEIEYADNGNHIMRPANALLGKMASQAVAIAGSLTLGEVSVSGIEFGRDENVLVYPSNPKLVFLIPVFDARSNDFLGALMVHTDAQNIFAAADFHVLPGESLQLYDSDGDYFEYSEGGNKFHVQTGNSLEDVYRIHPELAFELTSPVISYYTEQVKMISIAQTVESGSSDQNAKFIVISKSPSQSVFGLIQNRLMLSFVLFPALLLVSVLLAYQVFVRVVLRRIEMALSAIRNISTGNFSTQLEVGGSDELSQVTQGINELSEKLQLHESEMNAQQKMLEKRNIEYRELNNSLTDTQRAVLNILEDLKEEKEAVDHKIHERTIELEEEKEKLSHIAQNMQFGAILLDVARKIVFVNDEAYAILGLKKNARNVFETLRAMCQHVDINAVLDLKDKSGNTVYEVEYNGFIYEVLFRALARRKSSEKYHFGYLILIRNVTDERLLERSKSELVAVASHQLRTPLTAMRGNIEMLLDESFGKLNEGQQELLSDIEISSVRLITMVNDMLDITKIEGGKLDLKLEPFDVVETIQSVVNDLAEYAKRHKFSVHHRAPESALVLVADVIRARQVFQNLIDNSIKYSRIPGTLDITYETQENTVVITFADNGIGIPKAELSKMFQRFYRASNSSKTTSSGSGLGLYIVKSITEQMKGTITLESEEGVGTTFKVTLPLHKS